jgi:hypothetical protein
MGDYERGYRYQSQDAALEDQNASRQANAASRQQDADTKRIIETGKPVDENNPGGDWKGYDSNGKLVDASAARDAWLKTSDGQLFSRGKQADKIGLKGNDRMYYMANGKLREPGQTTNFHMPNAESQEYEDWKASTIRANGGNPLTPQQVESYHNRNRLDMTDNQLGAIETNKNNRMTKAQDLADAGKLDEGEYRSELQAAQNEYEQRLSAAGHPVTHKTLQKDWSWSDGGQPQQSPQSQTPPQQQQQAPPQQQQAAPQQKLPPNPKLPMGDGQKKLDPNTARAFLQASGGDKVKARQLAKANNWQ